jgi:hypothetical protein
MRYTAAHLPSRWFFLPIHPGNVKLGTIFGLTEETSAAAPENGPMTLDSWISAARGEMYGTDRTQNGGSARVIHSLRCPAGGRPASPRKSQTKSQRRPTSSDAQLRQAIVKPGQVPTERH